MSQTHGPRCQVSPWEGERENWVGERVGRAEGGVSSGDVGWRVGQMWVDKDREDR